MDMVTTPDGSLVAMVHCNNCTSDLNAWVNLFKEFAESFGVEVDMTKLFSVLYNKALEGDDDCGGLLAYNYFSGEHITGFEEGRPLFVRTPDSKFNLANFMRVHLFTALGALKTGLDILLKEEGVHGVTYMPARNTKEQMTRLQKLCRDYGMTEISGEDVNSSRQSMICRQLEDPQFKHLVDATWKLIEREKVSE